VTIKAGQQLPGFAWLKDDGTTACGNWLYSGSWTESGAQMQRRGTDDPSGLGVYPNWAWSWPANRRVMYNRLAALLRDKGLISTAEFEAVRVVAPSTETPPSAATSSASTTDVLKPEASRAAEKQATAPTVIAAVAPVRLLQVDPPKREGLIPDIRLGSGARLKLYGFFKTSLVHDSSSPQGNDFPLPLLAADTGPNNSPEFHLRARGLRLGANFEWLDPAPNTVITGRLEFDFEGDFTRVNNRNISSIRSS
jgi:hypothetical protein